MTVFGEDAALSALPQVLANGDLQIYFEGGKTWARTKDRLQTNRIDRDNIALSGMSLEELFVYISRKSIEGRKAWNKNSNPIGRFVNFLTWPNPGYAAIEGKVLQQIIKIVGGSDADRFSNYETYHLRIDLVETLRDGVQSILESQE